VGALTSTEASDIMRKRVAYYYLAVIDDNFPEEKDSRITNFIGYLCDIRRAHNTPLDSHTKDDPSCYPGTITRIANMGNFHPKVALPLIMNPEDILMTILNPKIVALFSQNMENLPTLKEKKDLFLALTQLSSVNAKDATFGKDIFEDFDEGAMLKMRNDFRDALPNSLALLQALKQKLVENKTPSLPKHDEWLLALIERRLSNIGGKEIVYALRERLAREMPEEKVEEIKEEWETTPFEESKETKEERVENPFIIGDRQRRIMKPELQKRWQQKAQLWENIYEALQETFPKSEFSEVSLKDLSTLSCEIIAEYLSIEPKPAGEFHTIFPAVLEEILKQYKALQQADFDEQGKKEQDRVYSEHPLLGNKDVRKRLVINVAAKIARPEDTSKKPEGKEGEERKDAGPKGRT